MKVVFGLGLDEAGWPEWAPPARGQFRLGPNGLLELLETCLGLSHPSRDEETLRIERFRQALRRHAESKPAPFYARSFAADPFATARDLLDRRDELIEAGWDLTPAEDLPPRLQTLAEVEAAFQAPEGAETLPGRADRLAAVRRHLRADLPVRQLTHLEPLALLPPVWRGLLEQLAGLGVSLTGPTPPHPTGDTDLARFQRALLGDGEPTDAFALKGDGSLWLLRGKREAELAAFLASLFRQNPAFRPVCVVSEGGATLDRACMEEGLPAMGLPSASLARPSLQVLKLITTFLWEPLDPFKVIQFVSLREKPLHDGLAYRIARALAESPGVRSEAWRRRVMPYLKELRQRSVADPTIDLRTIERQYRFLFERERYDMLGTVPRQEAIPLFAHLERWAIDCYDDEAHPHASLLVLAEQARRIRTLLENLPEDQLTYLELERIVRTVYEPAPVNVFAREHDHIPALTHEGAWIEPAERVLWWNVAEHAPPPVFARWYPAEYQALAERGVELEQPFREHDRLLFRQRQPILNARRQLILVIPEMIQGQEAGHHPILADLQARCAALDRITLHLEDQPAPTDLWNGLELPRRTEVLPRPLGRPEPFLQLAPEYHLPLAETMTFSNLEDLFYYPHQWVFRYHLDLRPTPILQIVDDRKLLGNLAHRLMDSLLAQPGVVRWPKAQVEAWIEREAQGLFQREAAVMLLYGREPQRVQFVLRVQRAAINLLNTLRSNGWTVWATEYELEGKLEETEVIGRADLILERGEERAIIDLKWGGYSYRKASIRNREDIQLTFYAHLLGADGPPPHTAFFILERGALLARDREAFAYAETPAQALDRQETHQWLMDAMRATYRWRRQQLANGRIELRCAHTLPALHEYYGEDLLDVLEMKEEDARWDDYRSLLYLVD